MVQCITANILTTGRNVTGLLAHTVKFFLDSLYSDWCAYKAKLKAGSHAKYGYTDSYVLRHLKYLAGTKFGRIPT